VSRQPPRADSARGGPKKQATATNNR